MVLGQERVRDADVRTWLVSYRREYTKCAAWRNSALDRIAALPRVDLVVVGRTVSYEQILGSDGRVLDREAAAAVWSAGATRTFERLSRAATRCCCCGTSPGRASTSPPACRVTIAIRWRARPRSGRVRTDGQLFAAEQPAVSRAGVQVVDLTPVICPGDPCSTVSPAGAIVYRQRRLTATFSRECAGAVLAVLRRYLP